MSWAHCLKGLAAGTLASCAAVALFGPGSAALAQPTAEPSAPTATPISAPAPARSAPRPNLSGGVAALVNDDVISTYDLGQRALLLIVTSGVPATAENMPQIQEEALRSLIDEHLQLQELHKLEKEQKFSIVADDEEVNDALRQLAKDNNSTLEELKRDFAKVGLDMQTLREQLRAQISWNRMISGRYSTRVRVGSDQIAMALQRMKQAADKPHYQISEIFIDASRAGGLTEAANGAQQLITQIQQGAPFAAVARQFSSAPTAAAGGDMGWVAATELPSEISHAVDQMRPGEISQPIPVNDGVYIVQLRDRRAGGTSTTVSLKQAAVRLAADAPADKVAAAQKTLEAFSTSGATCADLESKAAAFPDIVAGDLGESNVNDLSADFRSAADSLAPNQFSMPIRTPVGLHLLMVCARHESHAKDPTREEVENRLFAQQMSMLSRRYLRDLRNSATIETP
jgi:peptidyl-prolyl cis-trans isomerase SurA